VGLTLKCNAPGTDIYPDWVAVGDFNRDGKQDLVATNQFSKNVTILIGAGRDNLGAGGAS
jgi:hypothetical protein